MNENVTKWRGKYRWVSSFLEIHILYTLLLSTSIFILIFIHLCYFSLTKLNGRGAWWIGSITIWWVN